MRLVHTNSRFIDNSCDAAGHYFLRAATIKALVRAKVNVILDGSHLQLFPKKAIRELRFH